MTSSLTSSLELIEVKPGLKFSRAVLCDILPDIKTALFFGKVYELTAQQLGTVLGVVFQTDLVQALVGEGGCHSSELQDYIVDDLGFVALTEMGEVTFDPDIPKGEVLPEMWDMLSVEIADSIKAVAAKIQDVVGHMPGKQGEMVFRSMAVMNAKRPTIGDYKTRIHHAPQKRNLVIFDVSGSMSSTTVEKIVEDVVALSYNANASFAVVSNTATYWEPGTYSVSDVLAAAEYGGTHYEQLAEILSQDWGVVVTIADYDSSMQAKSVLRGCTGHIDQVLDVSLTCRPTFLAECVGQLADEVKPLLTAAVPTQDYVLRY